MAGGSAGAGVSEVGGMTREAILSPDGIYRYALTRGWSGLFPTKGRVLFIMLNPSTADALEDDPTLRRCIDFAQRWDYGSLEIVNLFAFRATNPVLLSTAPDPVGPLNLGHVRLALDRADLAIAGWGASCFTSRSPVLAAITDKPLSCLGRNADGSPRHPLYVHSATALEPFAVGVAG